MSRAVGSASLVGLILSLWFHLLTFVGVDVIERYPLYWFLHVGAIISAAATIPLLEDLGARPRLRDFRAILPKWAFVALVAVGIYAIVNFVLFIYLSRGGNPDVRDGKYVLLSHGRLIQYLTQAEYHEQEEYVARGFSGHWIAFFAEGTLVGLFRKRRESHEFTNSEHAA
jgi:hypothetical protein